MNYNNHHLCAMIQDLLKGSSVKCVDACRVERIALT